MPLTDVLVATRGIAALIDRAAVPVRAVHSPIFAVGKALEALSGPVRAARVTCDLDLPQLRNPMEMK